ncbi:MAG: hypothetical protein DLM53_04715 [Candidatus Eremiobacter antarcticus]|nr:hypothetical protein [Candidatus Eremiobacteraeota bacterium]MBC5807914.1 hypothetical protein [Candidatus Eremiobacteraeota bacterium]PZR62717.1 MAG: hypothetical protein DLM53_04715 [Candidatus Eremiobacter sp. RRmetagenome_bin22]
MASVLTAVVLGSASIAAAHPLGNFTINRLAKVRILDHRIAVHYVLDFAEIPAFQIMRAQGASNGSEGRLNEWAQAERRIVEAGLTITAAGNPVALTPQTAKVSTRPGAGGLPTLYWTADFQGRLPDAGSAVVRISDATYGERIGWKDIAVAPAREPTDDLRRYPNELLASPRDVRAVDVNLSARGTIVSALPIAQATAAVKPASQIRSNALSDLVARGSSKPLWVLITILLAVCLGALHALEPGHGKTLLAVSLVGARATTKQAIWLAVALTISHTAGVIALGVAMLLAAKWIVPEDIYPWVTAISGVAVAFIGARALARFFHAHGSAYHDSHSGAETHGHAHPHAEVPTGQAISFRNVLVLAMGGNVAPCPAALVVLLTALTLHRVGYGLLVIVAFSVGLAAVLTGLGIAFVRGATWLAAQPRLQRLVRFGPLLSGCAIALIGAIMLGQGLGAGALHAPAAAVTCLALLAIAGYAARGGHAHAHLTHVHQPHAVR